MRLTPLGTFLRDFAIGSLGVAVLFGLMVAVGTVETLGH